MPSKSAKQARTMRAAEHDKAFAAKVGIPQKVARDFVKADKHTNKYGYGSSNKSRSTQRRRGSTRGR